MPQKMNVGKLAVFLLPFQTKKHKVFQKKTLKSALIVSQEFGLEERRNQGSGHGQMDMHGQVNWLSGQPDDEDALLIGNDFTWRDWEKKNLLYYSCKY